MRVSHVGGGGELVVWLVKFAWIGVCVKGGGYKAHSPHPDRHKANNKSNSSTVQ